jgi:hypothetical protein
MRRAHRWVLNPNTMHDRTLVEAWDAGNMHAFGHDTDVAFPGYGTLTDWYHLVQLHVSDALRLADAPRPTCSPTALRVVPRASLPQEALFNLPYPSDFDVPASLPCCNYSLADVRAAPSAALAAGGQHHTHLRSIG